MKIELDFQTVLAVVLIIISGILFIYLPYLENNRFNPKPYIEHFPATMRHSENVRKEPKLLIPKIVKTMEIQSKQNPKTLPDDYMYLYNYEKNFDINKVYGDFSSRLDAYNNFLLRNKNNFHNLDGNDIDNLTKLLNSQKINESDIPNNFSYEQEFKAVNH